MIELNHLDYAIIVKNKIDPFRIFGASMDYTIEFQGYIIYLINSGKEVSQELFSEITREDRYKEGQFPSIESICVDILNTLIKNGHNIEDEKYNDVLLGVQGNDSMSENFVYSVVRENIPFPLSFAYLYEDYPKEAYYIFLAMIEYDYDNDIPDFILNSVSKDDWYLVRSIRDILEHMDNRKSYFKYIDFFMQVSYKNFNKIINQTKDLKNILKYPDTYVNESKIFFNYIEDLKRLLQLFINYRVIDKVDVFLDFLNTKKFQDHINIYLNFSKWKHKGDASDVKELKDLLSTSIRFPVKESFKAFFNR